MKYILLLATCIMLVHCKKSPYTDLSGTASLKGIALVLDNLTGLTTETPLKNAKVFLRYAENPNGFIYSTTTNAEGQYYFSGISLDRSYVVYTSFDTETLKYEGQLDYPANGFVDGQSDTLKLFPAMGKQNGIHLIVEDELGGRIPNITVWVYNSPELFNLDTSAGKAFDMVTNTYGVVNKYNVAPGKYFFRAKTKVGNIDFSAMGNVEVKATGIETVKLILLKNAETRNGIELTVLDSFETPASNAVSYFYKSFSAFQADTTAYSQSIFKLTSNANGLASTYFIDTGRYYFRTILPLTKDTLTTTDFINVSVNEVAKKMVTLQ